MSMAGFFSGLARCTSGSALLETAIALPVFVVLLMGSFALGGAFLDYATATESVRDAARYLARIPSSGLCTWGLDDAKRLAVYGTLDPAATVPMVPDWKTTDVTFPGCSSTADVVHLQASFPLTSLTLLSGLLPTDLTVVHEEAHVGE